MKNNDIQMINDLLLDLHRQYFKYVYFPLSEDSFNDLFADWQVMKLVFDKFINEQEQLFKTL